jgi:hypothetical protein
MRLFFDAERWQESTTEWRNRVTSLRKAMLRWQAAIRSGSPEVEQLRRQAEFAAFDAIVPPWWEGGRWPALVRDEPAIAAALVALREALEEAEPDDSWKTWDGSPFPWEAEVEKTLAALTAALDGREPAPVPPPEWILCSEREFCRADNKESDGYKHYFKKQEADGRLRFKDAGEESRGWWTKFVQCIDPDDHSRMWERIKQGRGRG